MKTTIAVVAIQVIVRIKSGVKIENVLFENRFSHCFECNKKCRKGLLSKIKPYGFTLFIIRYGLEELLDCLERNEQNGVIYHREGIVGDYDDFDDVEKLIKYIKTGVR